jgi:hypothetical protein
MAAQSIPLDSLDLDLDPDADLSLVRAPKRCRFCGCTEHAPCLIPIRKTRQGHYTLAADEFHASLFRPCAWYIPGVCTNPKCVAKLIIESIDEVEKVARRKQG